MAYHTSLLEDWIEQLYQQIGIYHPEQLDYQTIAKKLNIKLKFRAISSRLYKDVILIDDRLTPEQQFEEFSHEVCHKLRHAGNHMVMPDMFLELQEFQANHFALHFCVPTFMLKNLNFQRSRKETVHLIATTFGVTYEFAQKRLEIYENKLYYQKISNHL